jgi:hypothetical protein
MWQFLPIVHHKGEVTVHCRDGIQIDTSPVVPRDRSSHPSSNWRVMHTLNQRKDIYIEHWAGKTALLASWRKMTVRANFVGDGSFRGCRMRAHFPQNETL